MAMQNRIGAINSVAVNLDNVRKRISDIESRFGIGGDFQTTLENEIARQDQRVQSLAPVDRIGQSSMMNTPKINSVDSKIPALGDVPNFNDRAVKDPNVAIAPNPIDDSSDKIPDRDDKKFMENFDPSIPGIIPSAAESTENMLESTALKYGVNPKLVKAIAITESNLNQDAISRTGAIGVMQLMPETAASLGVDPYDREQNIEGGTRYIRQMLDKFGGNVVKAIAAYNAGPEAVKKYGGIPPYSETQNYVGRVLNIAR